LSEPRPVVIDLQAAQSVRHGERGIARYSVDLVRAIAAGHPDLVHEVLIDPHLPPVAGLEDLGVPVVTVPTWSPGGVFHILSPFELDVPVRRLWPRTASRLGMQMAVTVYDLIPDLFPEIYLQDPGSRRRYRARRELVRAADAVMAISGSAARDAVRMLGLPPDRVSVVGAAPAPAFVPPADRAEAGRAAMRLVAGLESRFVVYTGGAEPRKNMERLIHAWAGLAQDVRTAWQLVLVCKLDPLESNHYRTIADTTGVGDRVLLTGYVPDDVLRLLYQSTDLVVFPSLYEGYGLPVAEGLACGAPAIASATSSLFDLVPIEATFDPHDTGAVTAALTRALTDGRHRARLIRWAGRRPDRWADVADRTAEVYRTLASRPRLPRPVRRPRLALVSPMPPAQTGVADHSARLVAAAGLDMDIDVYPDGDLGAADVSATSPGADTPGPGAWVGSASAVLRPGILGVMEAVLLGYDAVMLRAGSGPFHTAAGRIVREGLVDGPIVLVEDPELAELPAIAAAASHLLMFDDEAAWAARRRLPAAAAGRVGVWPDVYPEVVVRSDDGIDADLVCSFGPVDAERPYRVVEAFSIVALARPAARLVLAGPAGDDVRARIGALAHRLGIGSRVTMTGAIDTAAREALYRRAGVAVQRGPASRATEAVADCLAHGIPTVLLGTVPPGAAQAVVHLPVDGPAAQLAAAVGALIDVAPARAELGAAGRAHAAAHGFADAAAFLLELVTGRRRADPTW
jgi:glycosyltransferase involved in cell wall biosynthesis